jgi:hypothetical protein
VVTYHRNPGRRRASPRRPDEIVIDSLGRITPDLDEDELYVSDVRNAKKPDIHPTNG